MEITWSKPDFSTVYDICVGTTFYPFYRIPWCLHAVFSHWLIVNRLESICVKRATNLSVDVSFKCHRTWSAYPFIFCNNKSEMPKTFNARKMLASLLCLSGLIEWHYFAGSFNSNCIFKLPFENFNKLESWNLLGLFCA